MGTLLDIEPAAENIATVQMLPLGVIAGRVLDQYGDPVQHAVVRALRGQDEDYEGFSAATTDDRGEYRIADVEPGKYYVAAEYSSHAPLSAPRQSQLEWPEVGGLVLLPGVADIGGAQQMEVSAGAVTRVNDLYLKIQSAITITGRVKPALEPAALALRRAGPRLGLNAFAGDGGASEADGSFTFHVLPGTYMLSASDQKTGKLSKEVTIEALDKNVSNIELTLDSSYEISGRIIIDGPDNLDFSTIRLHFFGPTVKIQSDGSFHENAFSPKAVYMLQRLPEDWYLKAMTVSGEPIDGRQFELKPGTNEVSLMLSPRGARVEIIRPSTANLLDSAIAVMLLPENGHTPDLESMVHAEPDQSAKLIAYGVPPGSYRVFALDVTNYALLFDPKTLLEKYGKEAPLVSVAEGEHKSIVVPLTKIKPE
jgi:hypothetical protein